MDTKKYLAKPTESIFYSGKYNKHTHSYVNIKAKNKNNNDEC